MSSAGKLNMQVRFKGIEVVQFTFNPIPKAELQFDKFFFNLQVEQKIDPANKSVHVLVHTDVRSHEVDAQLAHLSTLTVFQVDNFEEVIKTTASTFELPKELVQTLNSLSISTTRGILFERFRGTYLHQAILPMVDPKQLEPQKQ